MYIWLKEGALVVGVKFKVENDDSGKNHIRIYNDPTDPTARLPDIPQDFIESVTFQTRIYRGFRTEGLYRYQKATLRVKSDSCGTGDNREFYQEIDVSAPSIAELQEIYTLCRQGKLLPDEDWEAKQVSKTTEPLNRLIRWIKNK